MARKIVVFCLDSLENTLFREQGAGKAAYALSNSRDLRCRVILEQIKDYNQFPEDQGLASLGLAMVMKETTGMLQDDVRLVAARGKLLKDAIIKCYDSSFGPIPVQNIVKEELYEIRNLNIGQTGPEISLPSTAAAGKVTLPSGNKPVLVVFWDPQDMRSVQFLQKAASLRKEFPGLTVMPVAPGKRENIEKALLNLKMDMPSLVDEKAAAFKDYRVRLTPRVYLLDPAGKILMRGTPDMLFDANLYAVMGKLEGKKKEKPDGKKSPSSPASSKPVSPPARINSPDTRVPSVSRPDRPRPAFPSAPSGAEDHSLSAPPLRPMPE
jgi:peroxiredoxin